MKYGKICAFLLILLPVATTLYVSASPEPLNSPPSVEDTAVSTAPGIMVKGFISTFDPDGDMLEIALKQKPGKGSVLFDGTCFLYEPYPGKTGIDRFSVQVVDVAGNCSDPATIEIAIEENRKAPGFSYADMAQNPSHYAAIKLYDNDILRGRKIGERYFFEPEQWMTRSDYLILLLAASGRNPSPTVNTGLPNDREIPIWMKPYVKAALETGILAEGETFSPANMMIRAEAVVWCDRAAGILDVKEYPLTMPDVSAIPRWARQSYTDLAAYRMLDLYDGMTHPDSPLTNAYAADLAWQLYKYHQSNPGK